MRLFIVVLVVITYVVKRYVRVDVSVSQPDHARTHLVRKQFAIQDA